MIEALQAVVAPNPRWGFWKCYDRLRLDNHAWNHKRVYRVYRSLGLNLPRRTRRRIPPRVRQVLVAPNRLNEIWAREFIHDTLYGGRRFRTLNGSCPKMRTGPKSRILEVFSNWRRPTDAAQV